MRLAIVTSHPIQYNAPFFRKLAELANLELKIFYTWSQSKKKVYDPGFGQSRSWDLPLLEGYNYTFVDNKAKKPGSHHFWGIQNPSLIKEVELFQPGAILVYGWSFYSHLKLMRYFKGKTPIWFRGDSNLLDEPDSFSWKKYLRRLMLRWVYSHVDKAFYVGQANRNYYITHGLKPEQLVFAPHAIDNQRFAENSAQNELEAQKWRTQLGIPLDSVVFLFVGKFETKKNPLGLVQAFQSFSHHAYLILVGDGAEKGCLQKLAENDPRIILLGFQNQSVMPVVYRLANVLVLPSKGPNETWGLVVNEAFASSKPAIVSDKVGCAVDLVLNNNTGWTFSANDLIALADVLKIVLAIGVSGLDHKGRIAQELIQDWSFETNCHAIQQELNLYEG